MRILESSRRLRGRAVSTCAIATFAVGAILLWNAASAAAQQQMGQGMMNQGQMNMGQGCPFMSDGGGSQPGMMGGGMMGGGMGSGMGPSMMGHGMMGQGMIGGGMMGGGMMGGGDGSIVMRPAPIQLTVADVTYNLERILTRRDNPHLKLGSVADKDADTIVGEIVTTEGSLVERYEVDKQSGVAKLVP